MIIKILSNAVLILLIVLIQVSFLSTWPQPISNINLLLAVIIFVAVIINYEQGLWWALSGGLLLELYSELPYGTVTLSLIATSIIINFLFTNFFTNRSYYALALLGYGATICYAVFTFGVRVLLVVLGQSTTVMLSNFSLMSFLVWQPMLTVMMVTAIFFAYSRSTSRLKHLVFNPEDHYEISRRH